MDIETKEILTLILDKLDNMDTKIDNLETKVDKLDVRLSNVEVKLENEIDPKLQLLYENQISIIDQNKRFNEIDEKIEVMQTDIFVLKNAK